jgi:hypothetical protein
MTRRIKVGQYFSIGRGAIVKLGPDIDLDKEIFLDGNGQRITESVAQSIVEEIKVRDARTSQNSGSQPTETRG